MLSFIAVSTRWWKAMVVAVTMASECRRKEMEPQGKMTARKMMHMKGLFTCMNIIGGRSRNMAWTNVNVMV